MYTTGMRGNNVDKNHKSNTSIYLRSIHTYIPHRELRNIRDQRTLLLLVETLNSARGLDKEEKFGNVHSLPWSDGVTCFSNYDKLLSRVKWFTRWKQPRVNHVARTHIIQYTLYNMHSPVTSDQ